MSVVRSNRAKRAIVFAPPEPGTLATHAAALHTNTVTKTAANTNRGFITDRSIDEEETYALDGRGRNGPRVPSPTFSRFGQSYRR